MSQQKEMETYELSTFQRFLNNLEKLGNLLPTPFTIFFILFVATAIVSLIVSFAGVELINPANNELVAAKNFFSADGLHWILENLVTNFTGYAPLGLVLVMTLGIGLCEEVGLVDVFIRRVMSNVPKVIVPFAVVIIGLFANMASDTAMVVVPPLSAIVYLGVGRHPIAGMLTGYAGATLGYAANFMISGTDALISGITEATLPAILPDYQIDVTSNWYMKAACAVVLTIVYGLVSIYIVEPRLGEYVPGKGALGGDDDDEIKTQITPEERKALGKTGYVLLAYLVLIAIGVFTGLLLTPEGKVIGSPLLKGLVPLIFFLFIITGLTYGINTKAITDESEISATLVKRMAGMAPYIVMAFMSSQFISLFNWSNLGTLLSIGGAHGLSAIGFTGIPLIISFILLTALLDFLIGSGSAKWTIMAPIFIPMFSLLGFSPAFTQMAYRIGDSVSNVMSPTSAFLFMMLGEAQQKYDSECTLGTFLSCQFMFFISATISWIILVIIWILLDLPVGPGANVFLDEATRALLGI